MVYLVLSSMEEDEDLVLVHIEKPKSEYDTSYMSRCIESNNIHINYQEDAEEGARLNSLEISTFQEELNQMKRKKLKLITHLEQEKNLVGLFFKNLMKIMCKPWELLLNLLTPRSSEGYYLFIHFLVPSILIWNVSEIELFILEKIMKRLNISANILGLTITAWGNNAPDMFNVASAMSKGMVDLAINAAIASEIHNVLLGLALPWLVYNIVQRKPVTFTSNNLYAFTLFFFCFFVLSFIIGLKMNKLRFDARFAVFLIIAYIIFLLVVILIGLNSLYK